MNDKAKSDLDALAGEVKNLREDFGRIGRVLEELVRNRGSAAVDDATVAAGKAWDEVRKSAQGATKTMEQNPLATLAGAFGIGLLLGMLFGGRRG